MTDTQLLQELEALAERLSVEVSVGSLEGSPGGLCRHRGKWRLLVERRLGVRERVEVFLRAFSRLPLEEVFVVPEVRERIEEKRRGQGSGVRDQETQNPSALPRPPAPGL
jgi:hypothetical protein